MRLLPPKTTSQIHFQGVWCGPGSPCFLKISINSKDVSGLPYSKVALWTSVVFLCAKVSLAAASRVTCQFSFVGSQGRFEVKKLFNNPLSSKNLQWLLAGGWGNSHAFLLHLQPTSFFALTPPGRQQQGLPFRVDMERSIGGYTP